MPTKRARGAYFARRMRHFRTTGWYEVVKTATNEVVLDNCDAKEARDEVRRRNLWDRCTPAYMRAEN